MWIKNCLTFLLGVSLWATSQANIIINGTRIIYPSDKKNVSLELTNRDARPALVQAWIDNGNAENKENNNNVPFVITPTITRVEAKTKQTLRIRYTGQALATDRETLFYFNLLDIPPKPKKSEMTSGNYLQFNVRSRLKLFFRPSHLPYDVNEAYQKVTWQAKGRQLVVNNPTPYFITYTAVGLMQNKKRTAEVTHPEMIAPFSTVSFNLNRNAKGNEQVQWNVINDFGGSTSGFSTLTR